MGAYSHGHVSVRAPTMLTVLTQIVAFGSCRLRSRSPGTSDTGKDEVFLEKCGLGIA